MPRRFFVDAASGPYVHVDFGARPARPSLPHFPEIRLFGEFGDVIMVDVGVVFPNLSRLVVVFVNRGVELVFRQAPDGGKQFPRPDNGVFLVVIAERPVAEHFEKSMVVMISADLFEVVVLSRNAHALLRICNALESVLVVAEQNGLELVHSRVGKKERGIVLGNDRSARHEHMAFALEKIDEFLPYDGRCFCHVSFLLFRRLRCLKGFF